MFEFNTKSHTAYSWEPWTKWGSMSDRRYSSFAELADCPEYKAYEACQKAYISTMQYLPEELSNKLACECKDWEKSVINMMMPLSTIEWVLDDTSSGCPNPFCRFKDCIVTVMVDAYGKVTVYGERPGTLINYTYIIEEDESNSIQYGVGYIVLEDNQGNKAWFKFAN